MKQNKGDLTDADRERIDCTQSPSGEHEYKPSEYSRDDQGFYVDCVHCKQTLFINADSVDELYDAFGLNYD